MRSFTLFFCFIAAQASSSTSVKGASQEGIDRTSVDILQFAGAGSTSAGSATTSSAPTGFAALAQMAPNKPLFGGTPAPVFSGAASSSPFAGSGAPVFGGLASIGKRNF